MNKVLFPVYFLRYFLLRIDSFLNSISCNVVWNGFCLSMHGCVCVMHIRIIHIYFIWLNASIISLCLRNNSCWVTNAGHSRLNFYVLLLKCYVVKSIDAICRINSNRDEKENTLYRYIKNSKSITFLQGI